MEIAKIELEAVQSTIRKDEEQQVLELDALQLALIGGGAGYVVVG